MINPQTKVVAVSKLSPSVFSQLQSQHAQTISCACTTTSALYKTFVSHTVSFHPVCSSDFVNREWIEAFYLAFASLFPAADIRTTAFSFVSSRSKGFPLRKWLLSPKIVFRFRRSLVPQRKCFHNTHKFLSKPSLFNGFHKGVTKSIRRKPYFSTVFSRFVIHGFRMIVKHAEVRSVVALIPE